MGQQTTDRLLAAKGLVGQEQQQRTVADETKPQAAMKGAKSPMQLGRSSFRVHQFPTEGQKRIQKGLWGCKPPIPKRVDRLASGSDVLLQHLQVATGMRAIWLVLNELTSSHFLVQQVVSNTQQWRHVRSNLHQ